MIFGGKYEHRPSETIDAEEFIGKKGIQAKGKKASQYEIKEIRFGEPLHKPEDDAIQEEVQDETADTEQNTSDIDDILTDDGIKLPDPGQADDENDEQLSLF